MATQDREPGLREQPMGELFKKLSDDLSTLVRQELKLAQVEMTEKGKQAGVGLGMFGGAGLSLLDAGSGADLIVTGAGGGFVQGGAGSATIQAGLGANTLVFLNGDGGGTDVVKGFKAGTDRLSLRGFGGSGLAGSQVVGGSTVLTLTDNTRITLDGVPSLGGASFG